MKHCEQCNKRLPKRKPGPGKPRRFCDALCAQRNWHSKHKRVRMEA